MYISFFFGTCVICKHFFFSWVCLVLLISRIILPSSETTFNCTQKKKKISQITVALKPSNHSIFMAVRIKATAYRCNFVVFIPSPSKAHNYKFQKWPLISNDEIPSSFQGWKLSFKNSWKIVVVLQIRWCHIKWNSLFFWLHDQNEVHSSYASFTLLLSVLAKNKRWLDAEKWPQ